MNWLDFFASAIASIASLAWPVAVVAAVWIFRGEIRPLLPRLHLKHKDTEISFRLGEAEKTLEALPEPPVEMRREESEELSRFERLLALSPRSAMLEIRLEVEQAVFDIANAAGMKRRYSGVRQTLEMLLRQEVISREAYSLFNDLARIGNVAAHDFEADFEVDDVRRYRTIADRAIELLRTNPAAIATATIEPVVDPTAPSPDAK